MNVYKFGLTHMPKFDILIVDDIADNIRFLSNFLTDKGYNVRKALSGRTALKAISALPPDLLLLDVNMPEITGYEVCQALKENPNTREIPVIFLSAGNELSDKAKAFEAGAVDYVSKPFSLEEVLMRVQTQLTISSLKRELEDKEQQLQQLLNRLQEHS
jgi:PleD family two-component response regulator